MSGQQPASSAADSIQPTGEQGRIFSTLSYVLMWWSSLIVIQAFALGQAFLPPIGKLNLAQALLIMALAGLIFVAMLSLNGQPGLKYGIPFSIQARTAFGVRGSKIVEFLRAAPAIVWYGIGTWIAALAVDGILKTLTGFTAALAPYVYFIALQVLQTWLAYRGIRTMKWFNVTGSVVITAVMIYMMAHILTKYGFQMQAQWNTAPNWGAPFWVGLTSAIGILATVTLNISDMTRHLERSQRANWLGHLFGVVPPWFFMLLLGMAAGAALGVWDPVQALMQLSPNPVIMIVLLLFILIAQITTNLTINILPPALIFMDTFGIGWSRGVLITGLLGTLSFPWLLMANSAAFFGFILYYSALFGPILGVMLADYFVVRRRELDVAQLYVDGPAGHYWYRSGFNVAGLIAVFVPGFVTMVWFLSISWLIGVPAGFLLYLLLRRVPSARPVASAA